MRRTSRPLALLVAGTLLLAACSGDDDEVGDTPEPTTTSPVTSSTSSPSSTATSEPAPARPDLAAVRVRLTQVAQLAAPTALAFRRGAAGFYVAEREGRVRAVRNGAVVPEPVLDITGDVSTGGERGLLGLTFSPDGSRLYVSYTNRDGDSRVDELMMSGDRADTRSRRNVIAVDQPFANHNGGHVLFGPDGFLWFGLGDGGSQGDPQNHAQDRGDLLGSLLRVDPLNRGSDPYAIPRDNPFVAEQGARGEIAVYGVRNPWRFSFDRETGDLWVGDVGGSRVEEIDFVPRSRMLGANLGWNLVEGTLPLEGDPPPGAIGPVFEYGRDRGRTVTGGYVYRGERIPALRGAYLFADFYSGDVRGLVHDGGQVSDERSLGVEVPQLVSFAEDPSGELYLLSLGGPIYRLDP